MKKVTNKMLWRFAIGQLGWSLLSGIVVNWLVFFYQPDQSLLDKGHNLYITQGKVLIGLTVIGLITALCRVFDAFTDPWIASLSDRHKGKSGRRIPFMRFAAVPFGIVTVLVFLCPVKEESIWNNLFLFVMLLLFYLCMTTYCTPYNALIPELGKTQENRINVSTYISLTYFVGTAIAYLLPNVAGLFQPALSYTASLQVTIAIFAAIAVICMLVPVLTLKEPEFADITPSQTNGLNSLLKTFKRKEFRTFVKSDILYWIALTIFQTGLPFYITTLMGLDESMTFPLFALMTGMSLACYAPVNILAKKLGKKKLVAFAFLFFTGVFALTVFCGLGGFTGVPAGIVISVLAAVPMAILGILPQAVVADIAEYDAKETGESRDGMFYAARTFAFKMGQSVAMLLFTAIAKIGSEGMGCRITAVVAAAFCLLGGLVFLKYDEKKIIG